jgi:hypothetical protein
MATHVPILLLGAIAAVVSGCATSQANIDSATAAQIRAIRAQSVQGDKSLLFPGERRFESIPQGQNPLWLH